LSLNKDVDLEIGLDALHALITKVRENPSSYSPADLRACLDSFREPLMTHLDEEVYVIFYNFCVKILISFLERI